MGKGKLPLDKAISAPTGPMGSRPGLLSQPLCPEHTLTGPCPRVPTEGLCSELTTTAKPGLFWDTGRAVHQCGFMARSWSVSQGIEMLTSIWTLFLCPKTLVQLCLIIPFPLGKVIAFPLRKSKGA